MDIRVNAYCGDQRNNINNITNRNNIEKKERQYVCAKIV